MSSAIITILGHVSDIVVCHDADVSYATFTLRAITLKTLTKEGAISDIIWYEIICFGHLVRLVEEHLSTADMVIAYGKQSFHKNISLKDKQALIPVLASEIYRLNR